MRKVAPPSGGFTLIELILVVTVLGVLAAIGLMYLNQARISQKGYVDRIISDVMSIEQGIILYSQDGTNPRDICRNTIQNADNLSDGYTDCNQPDSNFSERRRILTEEGRYLFWPKPPLQGAFSEYIICCTKQDNKWRKSVRLIYNTQNQSQQKEIENIVTEIQNRLPYNKVDVDINNRRILYHVW